MKMVEFPLVFMLFLYLLSLCHCFHLTSMPCNVSLTDSCPAALYFVPTQPRTIEETSSLFRVDYNAVSRTIDGFLIAVNCSCPADHKEFVSHMDYTIQQGDTWDLISSKFDSFVLEKPEKELLVSQMVTLDLLCGCLKNMKIVTYTVVAGDTLFTICSRFGADLGRTAELNRLANPALIHNGDVIFIPTTGLGDLILLNDKGKKARKKSERRHIILGTVVAMVVVVLVFCVVLLWICYQKKKAQEQLGGSTRRIKCSSYCWTRFLFCTKSKESALATVSSSKAIIIPYSEILNATSNFSTSQKVGQGSYGFVYYGRLRGIDVAIKQMKSTKSKQFLAEVNILCKVHHTNLIELIGYAAGGDCLFLVYEYAENGALSDHLHNLAVRGYKPLSWITRVRIALDAAKGLEYIHSHAKQYYVHRDVKPSNILLDSHFRAKIADFGLVKLLEHSPEVGAATSKIVGTFGYLAPEYVRDGCVTPKCDVYAYGVVLMELITGQPALSKTASSGNAQYSEHRSLVDFMLSALEGSHDTLCKLTQCIDPNLSHYHKDSVLQLALLSKDCVNDNWYQRPDMSKVVLRLSHILARSTEWQVQNASTTDITDLQLV